MRIAVFLRRSALLAAVIVTLVPAAAALAAPSAAQARVSALYSGQTLRAGHQLTSPSGGYRAVLKNNGDFVVYGPNGKVRWHSRTAGKGATHVTMLPGGNVVIRTARNKTVWSSSTAPSTGDSLVIANNGTLTIYSGGGLPLWRNGKRSGYSADTLRAGQSLALGQAIISRSGAYRAIMQDDGNFVVYGPKGATWSTGTVGSGATEIIMQDDGNLVIYASGKPVWSSGTALTGGQSLVMQNDGNLIIYTRGELPLWSNGSLTGYSEDTLRAGQSLALGQALVSQSGAYRAIMQDDGNFVVYGPKGATWSTGTAGSGATEIIMQDDGNLVIYAPGKPVWSSGTAPSGSDALVMQNDGTLVMYSAGGLPLWNSGTRTGYSEDTLRAGQSLALGQALVSQSGAYQAIMQDDGNFVVYGPKGATWSTGTAGSGATDVIMQDDGNLVIYAPGKPVWSSGTALTGGQSLVMQNDGNLVIYSGGGAALWATQNSDWAGPGFCSSYNVRYTGTTYRGVAACGNADPDNNQGEISYKGVEFDSIGFQCVELAARYLYFITGKKPPLVPRASDYAYYIGADDGFQVYPGGLTGGTTKYQASLTPGQVISMWSASDQIGHVAVVTAVNVTNGNGTITVTDENANGTGSGTIKVSGGTMSYGGYPNFQWTTDLPS